MDTDQIKLFIQKLDSNIEKLLPELEEIYKDLHPYVFGFVGGTNPEIYLEAIKNNSLNSIPSNHSPKFAPFIYPTLITGLQAMMTTASVWLK